jgi:ABC-type lipoprotein export system ATPase subunit
MAVSRLRHGTPAIADSVHRATAEFALGRLHCVVGGPGDGNTTLLSLIAGYEAPDAGTISLGRAPVAAVAGSASPDPRRIGVVLPTTTLLAHLTVAENLILAAQLAGHTGQSQTARAADLAARVGLDSGSLARLPGQVSLLEQRLACLARATAGDPAVVLGNGLADNLGQMDVDRLFAALADLAHRDGRAVIVMTASPAIARRADEVWFMRNGVLLPATM